MTAHLPVRIEHGFGPADRPLVAALYWEAFGAKLGRALGPRPRALAFLETALDPDHALCARDDRGALLGVAGFKTAAGGLVAGGMAGMVQVYGPFGTLWRSILLAMLHSDVDNRRFLIDGIFVAPEARSRGVGAALIEALATEAHRRGYRELRLEVVDANIRARALYERCGFAATGRHRMGILRWIYGFSAAITMVRVLG